MISKIANFNIVNKFNLKNYRYQGHYFNNHYGADTVSFGNASPILKSMLEKQQIGVSDYTKIASDFGIKLLNDSKLLNQEYLKSQIQEFLKNNNIENIEIKNIEEHPDKSVHSMIAGCFTPDINDDLKGIKGGTLYISDVPKNKNDKETITAYIAFVCHELTHTLQYANDNSGFGFDNEINSIEEANKIFGMTNNLKPKIVPELQISPFQAFLKNYKKFNLSFDEAKKIWEITKKCKIPIIDKSVSISDDFIVKTLSSSLSLEEKVNTIVDITIDDYIKYNNVAKENQASIRKALLKRYIFEFKTEKEAYNTACEIIRKRYNINGGIVYDMVPRTYKMIEDVLVEKLNKLNT